MDEYCTDRRVLTEVEAHTAGTEETEVSLDGWCEGGLWQQMNDGRGCTTMRKR